jgi:hypothetical protein
MFPSAIRAPWFTDPTDSSSRLLAGKREATTAFTHAWYSHAVEVIVKNRDILGGTPVFRGTRVPVQVLFDYLEG